MRPRVRIGYINPSTNTAFEPLSMAMLKDMHGEVALHFSRFPVREIALSHEATKQFDSGPLLAAAGLLADAHVDVIAWHGTSGSWLGFEHDQTLCARITALTGISATTSILAMNELFEEREVRRLGLVTPYLSDVQEWILTNYRAAGITCVAERHLDRSDNFSFAEISDEELARDIRAVAAARPEGIAVVCSNLWAAPLIQALEEETGIIIYDSVAVTVWKTLTMVGVNPRHVRGWGRLFYEG